MTRKLQQFCPQCGAHVDYLLEGLCENCYTEGKKLLEAPARLDIVTCSSCGKKLVNNKWIDAEDDFELDVVRDRLRINGQAKIDIELKEKKAVVTAEGVLNEVQQKPKKEKYEIELKRRSRMCDNCARARGGYYEAVLQVRSTDERRVRRVLMLVDEVVERPRGKNWFVAKSANVRGGVDVYLGSRAMLTTLKKKIKADLGSVETKESYRLFGKIDGKDVYRAYLLVRA